MNEALFNHPKDWIDIQNIFRVRPQLDINYVRQWLDEFCEPDDERIRRVEQFSQDYQHRGKTEHG